jgi:hypothetical protein
MLLSVFTRHSTLAVSQDHIPELLVKIKPLGSLKSKAVDLEAFLDNLMPIKFRASAAWGAALFHGQAVMPPR